MEEIKALSKLEGRMRKASCPLEIKHPVVLPRKHHITELVVHHFYEQCEHRGRGMTTNEIRGNGFWIIGCSSAVSSQINKCVKCRKIRFPTEDQRMADLSEDRVEPSPPLHTVDATSLGPGTSKKVARK